MARPVKWSRDLHSIRERAAQGYGNDSVLCGARHDTKSLPYPMMVNIARPMGLSVSI
jgi:hypothetical protein